jgi:hypothetical protein
VSWVEVYAVLVVSHLVGDFILQTDSQARWKEGGLGPDPVRRRALRNHVATYTAAFLPALIWIAGETSVAKAVLIAIVVAAPHWIQDDGRLLNAWMVVVKGTDPAENPGLRVAVDQSFHLVFLFAAALLAAA